MGLRNCLNGNNMSGQRDSPLEPGQQPQQPLETSGALTPSLGASSTEELATEPTTISESVTIEAASEASGPTQVSRPSSQGFGQAIEEVGGVGGSSPPPEESMPFYAKEPTSEGFWPTLEQPGAHRGVGAGLRIQSQAIVEPRAFDDASGDLGDYSPPPEESMPFEQQKSAQGVISPASLQLPGPSPGLGVPSAPPEQPEALGPASPGFRGNSPPPEEAVPFELGRAASGGDSPPPGHPGAFAESYGGDQTTAVSAPGAFLLSACAEAPPLWVPGVPIYPTGEAAARAFLGFAGTSPPMEISRPFFEIGSAPHGVDDAPVNMDSPPIVLHDPPIEISRAQDEAESAEGERPPVEGAASEMEGSSGAAGAEGGKVPTARDEEAPAATGATAATKGAAPGAAAAAAAAPAWAMPGAAAAARAAPTRAAPGRAARGRSGPPRATPVAAWTSAADRPHLQLLRPPSPEIQPADLPSPVPPRAAARRAKAERGRSRTRRDPGSDSSDDSGDEDIPSGCFFWRKWKKSKHSKSERSKSAQKSCCNFFPKLLTGAFGVCFRKRTRSTEPRSASQVQEIPMSEKRLQKRKEAMEKRAQKRAEKVRSKIIDKQLQDEKMGYMCTHRLLLLGNAAALPASRAAGGRGGWQGCLVGRRARGRGGPGQRQERLPQSSFQGP
ncbi:guanine nucleotide-binding protein G(s) subunit alpha isoforms XLas-like [Tenrec ecaudatus]|uniref:guanine nucleotide-binding protein G(s) subunit alpha isoforms XLas-like n=1 Tax=Tenrec ecaudatus TaxID=94439 RepID=UPI003F596069